MSQGYMRQCVGKVRYETRDLAETARRRRASDGAGSWSMSNTNTYRCTQCGGYHNGHAGVRWPGGRKKGRGRR